MKKPNILLIAMLAFFFQINAQQVEVQGELKVTDMSPNETGEQLVIREMDGTLSTRSVASLPLPPPPIDTSKNLASDFELAKHICECGTDFPPFLIKSLLESGYTEEELLAAGVPYSNITNSQPITDEDGNEYTSVIIGTQTWLRENLKTTKYIDGSDIPLVENYATWSSTTSPAYSWYNNDIINKNDYGALYNWYAISSTTNGNKSVCPIGYHVPDISEVMTLDTYLGSTAGKKLKYPSLDYWNQITGANNSAGFNAFGGGKRWASGSFSQHKSFGIWWKTNEFSSTHASKYHISSSNSTLYISGNSQKKEGYSIRCIKD